MKSISIAPVQCGAILIIMTHHYVDTPPADVQLDKEVLDRLLAEKWLFGERSNGYGQSYVTLMRKRGTITETTVLTRYITDAPDDMFVDHINGNPRDNRLCNLRFATPSQNCANRAKAKSVMRDGVECKPHSKYLGVTWAVNVGKWQSTCRGFYLGRFTDEIQAAKAYDTQARKFYGEFARLNFPDSDEVVEAVARKHKNSTGYHNVIKNGERFKGQAMRDGVLLDAGTFDRPEDAYIAIMRVLNDRSRDYTKKRVKKASTKVDGNSGD